MHPDLHLLFESDSFVRRRRRFKQESSLTSTSNTTEKEHQPNLSTSNAMLRNEYLFLLMLHGLN